MGGKEHLMAADVTQAQPVRVLPSPSGEDEPRVGVSGAGAGPSAARPSRKGSGGWRGGQEWAGRGCRETGRKPAFAPWDPLGTSLAAGGGRAPAAPRSGRSTLELL